MKNLHECLVELAPYNIDFKIKDDKILLGLEYKEGWQVIKPDSSNIECFKYGDRYYYGTVMSNEQNINEIFGLIKLTIDYNLELEKKIKLFKEKVNELQDIFAKEDYDDLLNLSFQINKPKKRGRKAVCKVKENETTETIIEEAKEEEIVEHQEKITEDIAEDIVINDDDSIKYVNTMEDDEQEEDSGYSVSDLNNFIGIS